jgi:hypothetical protein
MASPGQSSLFTTFTELVTTTYRNHKKEIADNVSNHNALFRRLTQKGRIRREDGGLSIVANLEYAENGTYTRYSGYDPLNVEASDVLSAAEFPWRQVSVNVAASGLESARTRARTASSIWSRRRSRTRRSPLPTASLRTSTAQARCRTRSTACRR